VRANATAAAAMNLRLHARSPLTERIIPFDGWDKPGLRNLLNVRIGNCPIALF
jgi:hypothetical protein